MVLNKQSITLPSCDPKPVDFTLEKVNSACEEQIRLLKEPQNYDLTADLILESREILKRESLKSFYKMTPKQIKLHYQLLENLKHGW